MPNIDAAGLHPGIDGVRGGALRLERKAMFFATVMCG